MTQTRPLCTWVAPAFPSFDCSDTGLTPAFRFLDLRLATHGMQASLPITGALTPSLTFPDLCPEAGAVTTGLSLPLGVATMLALYLYSHPASSIVKLAHPHLNLRCPLDVSHFCHIPIQPGPLMFPRIHCVPGCPNMTVAWKYPAALYFHFSMDS